MATFRLKKAHAGRQAGALVVVSGVSTNRSQWRFTDAGGTEMFFVVASALSDTIEVVSADPAQSDHQTVPELLGLLGTGSSSRTSGGPDTNVDVDEDVDVDVDEDDDELIADDTGQATASSSSSSATPKYLVGWVDTTYLDTYTPTDYQHGNPVVPQAPLAVSTAVANRAGLQPATRASAPLAQFRKSNGLREGRESGFASANIAARVAVRVGAVLPIPTAPQTARVLSASRGSSTNVVSEPAKSPVGYLALVPTPVKVADAMGLDRHPVVLAELYARAYPSLATAWRRIRLLIAVNLRDDWRLLDDTTTTAATELQTYVTFINTELTRRNLPALAVPILWGVKTLPQQKKKKNLQRPDVTDVNVGETAPEACAEQLSSDTLRNGLRALKAGNTLAAPPDFPFATLRATLVSLPETALLVADLKKTNEVVFFHTGDADLISMSTLGAPCSLFQAFDAQFDDPVEAATISRAAGTFNFHPTEVVQHVRARGVTDGRDEVASLMLTMLAKSLDTSIRSIMAPVGSAYFAEPNTLLNSDLAETLKTLSNEHTGSMPDWASAITRSQAAQAKTQLLLPSPCHQLLTSSRNALVLVSDTLASNRNQVVVSRAMSELAILRAFANEHNTQIALSQLNERFKEARVIPGSAQLRQWLPPASDFAESATTTSSSSSATTSAAPTATTPYLVARAVWLGESDTDVARLGGTLCDPDLIPPEVQVGTLKVVLSHIALFEAWQLRQTSFAKQIASRAAQHAEYEDWKHILDLLHEVELLFRWALGMVNIVLTSTGPVTSSDDEDDDVDEDDGVDDDDARQVENR